MKKNNLCIAIGGVAILIAIAAFLIGQKAPAGTDEKLKVAASFYPMYYFSSQIGGDKADIMNITPAGTEPHDYEPTPQQLVRIGQSDLLILNGGGLEGWAGKIADEFDKNILIVTAGEGLATRQAQEHEEKEEANTDPHVWLNPQLAKEQARKILDGFLKADPANADAYRTNAASLENKLDALDREYENGFRSCARRDFVTSHAAFGYLADRYGLNQVSIAGLSPEEEPSSARLAEIADFVRKSGIKYIFFESLVSSKLSETIARETGAQTLVLDPIEGLSDNDLSSGKNYLTQMEMNLRNLRLALECTS